MRKRLLTIILAIVLSITTICFVGCGKNNTPSGNELSVIHDTQFGGIEFNISIDNFNKLGFNYGDSIKVLIKTSGKIDVTVVVPYYNGYYAKTEELLICSYPNTAHPALSYAQGHSSWDEFGCNETTKVTVTLDQKEKYKDIQDAMFLVYSNIRADFDSDKQFANFRELKGGNIKEGLFYRGTSPIDNKYNRAMFAVLLLEKYSISHIINLSDTEEKVENYVKKYSTGTDYLKKIFENNNVAFLNLNAAYRMENYKSKLANALYAMCVETEIKEDTKIYFHCQEGKDRTGVLGIVLLSLANATDKEIIDDYMITYDNYYHIKEGDAKYQTVFNVKMQDFLDYFKGLTEEGTMLAGAKKYLIDGGLSESQVDKIIENITK